MTNILKKFKTIFYYIASSGLSFIVDIAAFSIILYFIKNNTSNAIIIASFLARAISSIINYLVNKKFVFKYNKDKNTKDNTFMAYFLLVIINITISSILVSKIFTLTKINETIIKTIIDGLIFVFNYFIQKIFIFKNNSKSKNMLKYVLPIISFIALFIQINESGITFSYEIYQYIVMIFSLGLLYFLYLKVFKEENISSLDILSIIFSICMVVGYSYDKTYTLKLLYASELHLLVTLVKFIGYYFLIKNVLNSLYLFFKNHKFSSKEGKFSKKFSKHPFLYSFLALSIVYGLFLVFFYPGVINYDNANQIKEVMRMHTRYLDSIIVINENITLTNFNPIVHTLLLGNLFKWGVNIGNVNLGLFVYTLIQEIVVIFILAYSIYFLNKENIKPKYQILVLLCYIIIPFFPFYAMTAVKDTYFYVFVMLYIIKLYQFIKHDYKFKDYLILIMIMMLIILFRNNGLFLIIMSLPFCILVKKDKWRHIALTFGVIISCSLAYNYLIKYFEIPNTSVREALSIPFQQTARYVKDYPEDVRDNEKEVIDKILGYEDLAERYDPFLSDDVKNEYNKYATKADLKAYFKAWSNMFLRHPSSYINATISNTYGYFYPDSYNWYIYYKLNEKLPEAGFDYHFNGLNSARIFLKDYAYSWQKIPVLRLLVSCGFYTFAYIFLEVVLVKQKKKHLLLVLTPAFSLILMCFLGPANTYFRYVLPYAGTFPLILMLFLKEVNTSFSNNK